MYYILNLYISNIWRIIYETYRYSRTTYKSYNFKKNVH